MRSPIRKDLVKKFVTALSKRLPQFERVDRRTAGDYPMWRWALAPDLAFFIMLQPFEKKDEFTIEVGWADDGGFPWNVTTGSCDPNAQKCRRRLARLWSEGQEAPTWAVVPPHSSKEFWEAVEARERGEDVELRRPIPPVEEVLPRVGPLVDDAVQKLIEFGLPLFRRVVDRRGLAWPVKDDAIPPALPSRGEAE